MTKLDRRELLQWAGTSAAAGALFSWTTTETQAAAAVLQAQAAANTPYKPRFFTPHEYATVTLLADIILPKDATSGSASEAGTHEFIDYITAEQPERQTAMRGGLAWLDAECYSRFDKTFLEATDAQRRQVLDEIAFPRNAKPEFKRAARFFSTFRDLVAAGFFSSKAGMADIGYMGNRPTIWSGPPPDVIKKLGL
jgi:gluconate 2-dehydrogenase gamma chain